MKTGAGRVRRKTLDMNDPEMTWDLAVKHAREVLAQKRRLIDAMRTGARPEANREASRA